jgi:hypothetical protein
LFCFETLLSQIIFSQSIDAKRMSQRLQELPQGQGRIDADVGCGIHVGIFAGSFIIILSTLQ